MPSSAKLKTDALAAVDRVHSLGYDSDVNGVLLDAVQKSGGSQFRAMWIARSQLKQTGMSIVEIITLIQALITIWKFLKDRGVLNPRRQLGSHIQNEDLKTYLEGIE